MIQNQYNQIAKNRISTEPPKQKYRKEAVKKKFGKIKNSETQEWKSLPNSGFITFVFLSF